MKFSIVTLFPDLMRTFSETGLIGQSVHDRRVEMDIYHLRDFTNDPNRRVDDKAFGGSDGMVLCFEPLARAVEHIRENQPSARVVVLTPQGERWSQVKAREWAVDGGDRILICGRYAGFDQRFIDRYADEEISIGDFVLNGGEVAAMAVVESCVRLIPGVLGNTDSPLRDSFGEDGLLEAPVFTRPREIEGMRVPEVLLSGNHAWIQQTERAVAILRTYKKRPDLVDPLIVAEAQKSVAKLSPEDRQKLGIDSKDEK